MTPRATKPPAKTTARKPAAKAPTKPRPKYKPRPYRRPPVKRTQAERRSHAIELCLSAIAGGWTLTRFARLSCIHKSTLLRWMAEPLIQPRYLQAMQVKALALPDDAMEVVRKVLSGEIDPKAGRVALGHYEYRIQREIKALYQPSRTVTNITEPGDIPDEQLNKRVEELVQQELLAHSGAGIVAPDDE